VKVMPRCSAFMLPRLGYENVYAARRLNSPAGGGLTLLERLRQQQRWTTMNRKMGFILASVLASGSLPAYAGDLGVSVACPTTVQVGQPLKVRVTLSNYNCTRSITIERLMLGVAGNGAGALEIQGPFNKTFDPPKTVPAATCPEPWNPKPGKISFRIPVINATPANYAGTMAMAYVETLDAQGHGQDGNQCFAPVEGP